VPVLKRETTGLKEVHERKQEIIGASVTICKQSCMHTQKYNRIHRINRSNIGAWKKEKKNYIYIYCDPDLP